MSIPRPEILEWHERRIDALERRIDILERMFLDRTPPTVRHDERGDPAPVDPRYPQPSYRVEPPDPEWIPVLHSVTRMQRDWPRPCGQVGVYLQRPIREGERCDLTLLRVLIPGEDRWREPTTKDTPRCSSCGELIDPFSSADLDYLSVMLPAGTAGDPPPGTPGSDRARPPSPPARPYTETPEAAAINLDVLAQLSALSEEMLGRREGA